MRYSKITLSILGIMLIILIVSDPASGRQAQNTEVFKTISAQYENSQLFISYENDREKPLSTHQHSFLSKISPRDKDQASFCSLNLADIDRVLVNHGLSATSYFRYRLLSNVLQELRQQLFMDSFLHVLRLLFDVLNRATYVPVDQSFSETCYNQTLLTIGTANLSGVNEELIKQYPTANQVFGSPIQEASKFRNYEVAKTLDDVCCRNAELTKASSAKNHIEFQKTFDDVRIDDNKQITSGATPEGRSQIIEYHKRRMSAIREDVIIRHSLNRSMVTSWEQEHNFKVATILREAKSISGDRLKVRECGSNDGVMSSSCAILSGTGQSNASGEKPLYQRFISSIAHGENEDLSEINGSNQLLPGYAQVAATSLLLGNNAIALKSDKGYLGNFSGPHSFNSSFIKTNLLSQFIKEAFFLLDPYSATVLHARSGGDSIESGGHVLQITIDSKSSMELKQTWNPLWLCLNFWSIVSQFKKVGSLDQPIKELRALKLLLDKQRSAMKRNKQSSLPFELTKEGQLNKLQNSGQLDKFRYPEQFLPLRRLKLGPADPLDMVDPIPQRLGQFERLESLRTYMRIVWSFIEKRMTEEQNRYKGTLWQPVIIACAQ